MIGRNVEKYVKEYVSYFNAHKTNAKEKKQCLIPAPRVIIDRVVWPLRCGQRYG